MFLIKKIFGADCQIACISAMTDYYVNNAPLARHHFFPKPPIHKSVSFKLSDYLNADYVIIPGMVGTLEYLNAPSKKMIDVLAKKGCRPIFLGLGGEKYDEKEFDSLKKYFEQIKPALITTRDNEIYEQYKNVAPCVKAIDCAFWTIDMFDPRGFVDRDYDVVTFNRIEEPEYFKNKDNVVRPWHMQYLFRREQSEKTTLISDTPYDYLTVYANANRVYTDLVHATIVSLMYGTPVKYWENGKRFKAFYALDELKTNDGFLFTSEDLLEQQKEQIVINAKKIIEKSA